MLRIMTGICCSYLLLVQLCEAARVIALELHGVFLMTRAGKVARGPWKRTEPVAVKPCIHFSPRRTQCKCALFGNQLQPLDKANRDVTASLIETVLVLALKSRLKHQRGVAAEVVCNSWGLLGGQVQAARVVGKGWESPLGLTARLLQADVGETIVDYAALVMERQIKLKNQPTGSGRVVFNDVDFGNFLVHPLMQAAAATAVKGLPFVFERSPVFFQPHEGSPALWFTGTWAGDGQRYQLALMPCTATDAAATNVPPAGGVVVVASAAPVDTRLRSTQQHPTGSLVKGRSSSGSSSTSSAVVSHQLTAFFNTLLLDLMGAEFRFYSIQIRSDTQEGFVLDLGLQLNVRSFPPLNLKF